MSDIRTMATAARKAGADLARLSATHRSALLRELADALLQPARRDRLLASNARDMQTAEAAQRRGELGAALVKRLELSQHKLEALADGLRTLAAAPELVGRPSLHRELDEGLLLTRVAAPLGLLGVVFESRPDAIPQITGLAIKSGNAVLLKGGKEARESNRALVELLREVLGQHDIDPGAVSLLEDRAEVAAMLALDDLVDMIIARGSSAFVHHVRQHTDIPVMGHAEGLCHLYLHATAGPQMAARIAVDAKCGYPAACNAIETLLWDDQAGTTIDACLTALLDAGVELRGCARTRARNPAVQPAQPADWDTEYGAAILSIKAVAGLEEALAHIATHGSGHTEAIVASDAEATERFLAEVDAAGVFHNASTRFADGYRYGLGAEVGISTGKLHARGPVGVEGLLTHRWLLRGHGQVADDYGPNKRSFTHRDLDGDADPPSEGATEP